MSTANTASNWWSTLGTDVTNIMTPLVAAADQRLQYAINPNYNPNQPVGTVAVGLNSTVWIALGAVGLLAVIIVVMAKR